MKRTAVFILTFFLTVVIFPLVFYADEPHFPVPETAEELVGEMVTPENSAEILSLGKILRFVFSSFVNAFTDKFSFIVQLFVLLFAIYLINSFSESFGSQKLLSAMSFSALSVCSVSVFSDVFNSTDAVSSAFSQLSGFLSSLFPAFLTSLASAGYSSVAATGGSSLFFSVEVISAIICGCLKPFSTAYIVVGIVAGISDNVNVKAFSAFIRNFFITSIGVILTVFGGMMSLQTTLSMTSDNLFKRTAKLAAGTFIPLFGGSVGEGLESAFASAVVMKNSLGVFGTSVVFLTMLPSLSALAADLIIFSVSCAVCGFFGNEKATSFFSTVRDCIAVIFSAATVCCFILLIGLSLLIKI